MRFLQTKHYLFRCFPALTYQGKHICQSCPLFWSSNTPIAGTTHNVGWGLAENLWLSFFIQTRSPGEQLETHRWNGQCIHTSTPQWSHAVRESLSRRAPQAWHRQGSGCNRVHLRFVLELIYCCRYVLPHEISLWANKSVCHNVRIVVGKKTWHWRWE